LKNKGDFSMHGVVLQNRVFRAPDPPMFHVKHRRAPRRRDVSRETVFSSSTLAKIRRRRW